LANSQAVFQQSSDGISGSLEMMRTRIVHGRLAEVDRYVQAAQGAAKRAAALTHRLLAFSRRQTLAPKPTDVKQLVLGMEDLIRRTVGPAVEIETMNAVGLWPSLIDPSQLENAILNLRINARDAMPDGGKSRSKREPVGPINALRRNEGWSQASTFPCAYPTQAAA
jgi:signal transduction histidine kinase